MSWYDFDLIFDLAVVTSSLKILTGLGWKLIFGRDIGWGVDVQCHGVTLF